MRPPAGEFQHRLGNVDPRHGESRFNQVLGYWFAGATADIEDTPRGTHQSRERLHYVAVLELLASGVVAEGGGVVSVFDDLDLAFLFHSGTPGLLGNLIGSRLPSGGPSSRQAPRRTTT